MSVIGVIGRRLFAPAILKLAFFLSVIPGALLGAALGARGGMSASLLMHGGPGAWFAADLHGRMRPVLGVLSCLMAVPVGLVAGFLTGPFWFGFLCLVLARNCLLGRPRLRSALRRRL
ncbi:MAG: hypothetical protein HY319_01745 [Armatimonadetes bacterium]|nr:hypothetical protein [Armatimonadota bacterium]